MSDRSRAALLESEQHWVCPNCPVTSVTHLKLRPGQSAQEMHNCAGLAGLIAPMVLEGVRCKVEAVERGDYVGDEMVRYDGNGRAVMAVRTVRDDGIDCAVLAPAAVVRRGEFV